jgi:hypothetical protein
MKYACAEELLNPTAALLHCTALHCGTCLALRRGRTDCDDHAAQLAFAIDVANRIPIATSHARDHRRTKWSDGRCDNTRRTAAAAVTTGGGGIG